jgi:hypothetical protein
MSVKRAGKRLRPCCACDGDCALLDGLAQHLERRARELAELVEIEHAVLSQRTSAQPAERREKRRSPGTETSRVRVRGRCSTPVRLCLIAELASSFERLHHATIAARSHRANYLFARSPRRRLTFPDIAPKTPNNVATVKAIMIIGEILCGETAP